MNTFLRPYNPKDFENHNYFTRHLILLLLAISSTVGALGLLLLLENGKFNKKCKGFKVGDALNYADYSFVKQHKFSSRSQSSSSEFEHWV